VSYSRKKIWGLLLVGLLSEAVGFVLIKRGLSEVPAFSGHSLQSLSFLLPVITSPQVLIGTAFEALHFGVLMELLSVSDVSYIIPLTSIGYVLTPLSALFFLQEKIPTLRWIGIFLVCTGVAAVSLSDRSGKDHSAASRSHMDAASSS
jgi:drug/metabolite transporter (DMT)-like permease